MICQYFFQYRQWQQWTWFKIPQTFLSLSPLDQCFQERGAFYMFTMHTTRNHQSYRAFCLFVKNKTLSGLDGLAGCKRKFNGVYNMIQLYTNTSFIKLIQHIITLSWLQTEWHAHTQMLPKYNLSGEVNKYPCYGNNGWTEQNPLGALREQHVVVFRIKKKWF